MENLFKLLMLSAPEHNFVIGFVAGVADTTPDRPVGEVLAEAFAEAEAFAVAEAEAFAEAESVDFAALYAEDSEELDES